MSYLVKETVSKSYLAKSWIIPGRTVKCKAQLSPRHSYRLIVVPSLLREPIVDETAQEEKCLFISRKQAPKATREKKTDTHTNCVCEVGSGIEHCCSLVATEASFTRSTPLSDFFIKGTVNVNTALCETIRHIVFACSFRL